MSIKKQAGMSIYMLSYIFVTLGFVGFIGLKMFNPITDYLTVQKMLQSIAGRELKEGASVADIRKGFAARAVIDYQNAVKAEDLEITKEGNDTIVTAEWQAKVPLFANVSLVVDFRVSTQ